MITHEVTEVDKDRWSRSARSSSALPCAASIQMALLPHGGACVCVLIRRRTDECTKTQSGNAGKSRVDSANKLFPEPTFPYLCGGNISSGPLEFSPSSSSSQQVCINTSYLWHVLMKIQGVPSIFFVICICSHGNKAKVAKECAGCLIPPPPVRWRFITALKLCVCTKRKLKNSMRRPSRRPSFQD